MNVLSENKTRVPFVDLVDLHEPLVEEIAREWTSLLRGARFIGGDAVHAFETSFARYVGVEHAVAVSSGTSALQLALAATGAGPGDEVVTVAHTFFATAEAIAHCGATPVFVDVEADTANLDPDKLEAAIGPRTRAIVPVHLYGHPASMDAVLEIADRHGIAVVEDAAQAHGARIGDRSTGSFGRAAAFSFYPGKNLGACGEGGAVTTDDAELAGRVRALRDHGQTAKHVHTRVGWNARLDALQCAALSVKLPHLDAWNDARARAARVYLAGLTDTELTLPVERAGVRHVWHLFVVRHPERDRLAAELAGRDIGTGLHYPTPLHLQPAFGHPSRPEGTYPVAERWAREGLSLPMYPGLDEDLAGHVVQQVRSALERMRADRPTATGV